MAKFVVETTTEVYGPKYWKFKLETTMKFKVETTIKVFCPKDWKPEVETTEQKLKKFFVTCCFEVKKTYEK